MAEELVPLIGVVVVVAPPVIYVAGPWVLLGLMLSGPFALVVALFVVAIALGALAVAVLAVLAAPYRVAGERFPTIVTARAAVRSSLPSRRKEALMSVVPASAPVVADRSSAEDLLEVEQLIARVLGQEHQAAEALNAPDEARVILRVAESFADELAAANPAFDRVQFIQAATTDLS